MPANSLGLLTIVVAVNAQATYTFSPQDSVASLTGIPNGGTTLHLPPDPSSGDRYEFADADGSCSATNPIILAAAAGTTIRGLSATQVAFSQPFSSGACVFDEARKAWLVVSSANANPNTIEQIAMFSNTAAVTLTSAGVQVLQGSVTVGGQDSGLFFSGFLSVLNPNGPVADGGAQAVLTVDGVTQDAFAPAQDFGTVGLADVHLSGFIQLATGAHTLGLKGSAPTAAGLIVPVNAGHLTVFRFGLTT